MIIRATLKKINQYIWDAQTNEEFYSKEFIIIFNPSAQEKTLQRATTATTKTTVKIHSTIKYFEEKFPFLLIRFSSMAEYPLRSSTLRRMNAHVSRQSDRLDHQP